MRGLCSQTALSESRVVPHAYRVRSPRRRSDVASYPCKPAKGLSVSLVVLEAAKHRRSMGFAARVRLYDDAVPKGPYNLSVS